MEQKNSFRQNGMSPCHSDLYLSDLRNPRFNRRSTATPSWHISMTTISPDELKWLNVTRAVAVRVVPIVGLVASLADQACTNEPRPTRPPGVSEWSVSTEPYSVVGREGDPHLEFHHIAGVARSEERRV